MAGYAQLALSAMLSWVKGAAQQLWNLFSADGISVVNWLLGSWWKLAAALLVLGTAADLLVHLFRWRPLTVYASFFRRLREREDEEEPAPAFEEPAPVFNEPQPVQQVAESYPGAAVWNPQPAAAPVVPEEKPAPGRLRQLAAQLGEADDPLIRYQPPKPAVDMKEAYHEPVYPVVHTPADPENGRRRRRRSQ